CKQESVWMNVRRIHHAVLYELVSNYETLLNALVIIDLETLHLKVVGCQ
ncbi:unnamed protein product, partial [Allacma fusca]